MRHRIAATAVALLAVSSAVTACSSDTGNDSPTPTTAAAKSVSEWTDTPGGETQVVELQVNGSPLLCVSFRDKQGESSTGGLSCNWEAYNRETSPEN